MNNHPYLRWVQLWLKSPKYDMNINPNTHFLVTYTYHMWHFSESPDGAWLPETIYVVRIWVHYRYFPKNWVYINPKISWLIRFFLKKNLRNFSSLHMWFRKKFIGYISISFIWFQLAFWGYDVRDSRDHHVFF